MNIPKFTPGNTIAIGSTRCGKSVSAIAKIVAAAQAGWAIVCVDPHSHSLAWNAFVQLLARGFKRRILYDRLSEFDFVPGYNLGRPSQARNPLRREAENEDLIEQLTELAGRRRGMSSLAPTPQIEEFTRAAFQFVVHQRPPRSLSDVCFAYQPRHRRFLSLLQRCYRDSVRCKFEDVAAGRIRANQYAAAARLLNGTFGSPIFTARCGHTFDLPKFLNQRGILFVEGGEGGVSEDAKRTVMGAIILQTIHFIRTRRRSSPRVLLVLDEAANANLIGEAGHEVRALAECQKWGLDTLILVQSPSFSTAITEQIFSNCVRHEWFFNANDAVARKAAADLGDPELRNAIRQLRVGERWVKDRHHVYHEQVKMLPDPWVYPGLAEKKARRALAEIRKSRPEYHQPTWEDSPWSPNTSNSPENETNGSSAERIDTFASPDISSLDSPADRLRTED